MKFGNLYWFQTPDFSYPVEKRIREGLDLAVESESLGFDSAWFSEQHFHNYGYSPNPLMLAQFVASRTSRIRVGLAILVLPLWNPVRLAEDIALVDILSNGRLDVGLGRGYQHNQFRGLNVKLDDKGEMFDEAIAILMQAWTSEQVRFEGKHFSFPHGLNVLPKPVQKPHPPIYYAVTSDDGVRKVAKTDFHVLGSANWASRAQAVKDRELYLSERAAAGLVGDNWSYSINRQCYVIPKTANRRVEKEEFERRCRYTIRMARAARSDTAIYDRGYVTAPPLAQEETSEQLFDRVLFGYPEEVAEQILRLHASIPIDIVMLQSDFGGLSHEKSRLSQQLFGSEVIPIIKREVAAVQEKADA
jgi:alkanesulfonate monooxygenase SsuD/methylene tetrahydromethanopterin reductase-like flavin-dependent oxidoreductase (luciferase family)